MGAKSLIKHYGFIHQTVIVILVSMIRISYLSNFGTWQWKFSRNEETSFILQLASYSDFFSPKKKEKKEPCYSDHSICLVTTSHVCDFHIARFLAWLFFFFSAATFDQFSHEQCTTALSTGPTNSTFQHRFH